MADPAQTPTIRCAIYTRKSSEEGLEQAFNSLHAQREACEAYIKSQRHEGWSLVDTPYDDGAYSGGNMQRPALQALMGEVKAGNIDVVVVYKVDRLTRSLTDFAKIVDVLDTAKASFVSVTQAFNTTTSMGRLTLNVLLSFAQFEREVTGERIRDKIAASKKKGMWIGGVTPLGYDVRDRGLVINAVEAETVRTLFDLFRELKSVDKVKVEADARDFKTKTRKNGKVVTGGQPFSRGSLYHLLENPIYAGRVSHKSKRYAGLHAPIIAEGVFDEVQAIVAANRYDRKSSVNAREPSPLAGVFFDEHGRRLTATHTSKKGRRYRYYVAAADSEREAMRLPAERIEGIVKTALVSYLRSPERIVQDLATSEAAVAHSAIDQAGRSATALVDADEPAYRRWVGRHIDRVLVEAGGVRILGKPGWLSAASAVTIQAPFTVERRGVELKLVVDNAAHTGPDRALVRLIGLGATWFEDLKAGRVASVRDLAKREAVTPSYASRLVEFAFLSPRIKQQILSGDQPVGVTTMTLFSLCPLPLDWAEQEARLVSLAGPRNRSS